MLILYSLDMEYDLRLSGLHNIPDIVRIISSDKETVSILLIDPDCRPLISVIAKSKTVILTDPLQNF